MDYERSDDLPEFTDYRDEGCRLAPSCLNCPFPRCIHDMPRSSRLLLIDKRNDDIIRRFQQGETRKDLAAAFNLSLRTVERIVKNNTSNTNHT